MSCGTWSGNSDKTLFPVESSQDSGVRRSRTHNATLKVASARPAASQAASRSPPRPTPRDVACHRQARCPPVLDGGFPRDRLPYNSPPPCHSEPSTKQLAVSPSSSCHPPVPSHPSARRKQRPPRKPHQPPAAQNPSRPSDLLMVMEQQIRGASGTGSEVPVVNKPEDAVPVVLPLGPIDREEALLPATQEAVAHQVSKLVLHPYYMAPFPEFPRGGGSIGSWICVARRWNLVATCVLAVGWIRVVDLGMMGRFGSQESPDPDTGEYEQSSMAARPACSPVRPTSAGTARHGVAPACVRGRGVCRGSPSPSPCLGSGPAGRVYLDSWG